MQPPVANTLARPLNARHAAARNRYRKDGSGGMSPGRLLVALYERLLLDLDGASAAIADHRIEDAHLQLVHAQEIVESLDQALDHAAWDQSDRLSQIYQFVRTELIRANITKDSAVIGRCRRVLEPLADTWREALELTALDSTGKAPA